MKVKILFKEKIHNRAHFLFFGFVHFLLFSSFLFVCACACSIVNRSHWQKDVAKNSFIFKFCFFCFFLTLKNMLQLSCYYWLATCVYEKKSNRKVKYEWYILVKNILYLSNYAYCYVRSCIIWLCVFLIKISRACLCMLVCISSFGNILDYFFFQFVWEKKNQAHF